MRQTRLVSNESTTKRVLVFVSLAFIIVAGTIIVSKPTEVIETTEVASATPSTIKEVISVPEPLPDFDTQVSSAVASEQTRAYLEAAARAEALRRAKEAKAREAARVAAPRASRSAPVGGDIWAALARCESGNTNDLGAPYYGYFQFSPATWRSVGGTGLPSDHDYGTQLAFAQKLQARSGWLQWPACARKLGLA